ncbi:MAG: prepilin-type N-terminal cleavage/methylation domain-containing protein [bacterium]
MGTLFDHRVVARYVTGIARARGFTLIEMLAVLAIIVIITAIAFTGQSIFNRTLTLANTAYNVALSIRQAENYGIASRTFGSVRNAGYGVRFEAAVKNAYYFYADVNPVPGISGNCHCADTNCAALPDAKPGNCVYDASYGTPVRSELVSQYTFGSGISVKDFCGTAASGGATHCAAAAPNDLRALDIVFVRPNTQVTLTATQNNGTRLPLSQATVYLGAGTGQRCVTVSAIGQVSVPLACP